MQQLATGTAFADHAAQAVECIGEELAVVAAEIWGLLPVGDTRLRSRDAVHEVRSGHIDAAQSAMEPEECLRIPGRRKVRRGSRLVVSPQCDDETILLVDAWLHPRLKRTHRSIGLGETAADLQLELSAVAMRRR